MGSKAPKFKTRKKPATAGNPIARITKVRRGKLMRVSEVQENAEPGQHKYKQANNLDKNINQNACDSRARGQSELHKKPRSNDITSHNRQRK